MTNKQFLSMIEDELYTLEANGCAVHKLYSMFDEEGRGINDFLAYQVITKKGVHNYIFYKCDKHPKEFTVKDDDSGWNLYQAVRRLAYMQIELNQDCGFVVYWAHKKSPLHDEYCIFSAKDAHEKLRKIMYQDCSTESDDLLLNMNMSDDVFRFHSLLKEMEPEE